MKWPFHRQKRDTLLTRKALVLERAMRRAVETGEEQEVGVYVHATGMFPVFIRVGKEKQHED